MPDPPKAGHSGDPAGPACSVTDSGPDRAGRRNADGVGISDTCRDRAEPAVSPAPRPIDEPIRAYVRLRIAASTRATDANVMSISGRWAAIADSAAASMPASRASASARFTATPGVRTHRASCRSESPV